MVEQPISSPSVTICSGPRPRAMCRSCAPSPNAPALKPAPAPAPAPLPAPGPASSDGAMGGICRKLRERSASAAPTKACCRKSRSSAPAVVTPVQGARPTRVSSRPAWGLLVRGWSPVCVAYEWACRVWPRRRPRSWRGWRWPLRASLAPGLGPGPGLELGSELG
eukprot:scaffold23680_cov87-Phaeocystis_antarctica.AAC.2